MKATSIVTLLCLGAAATAYAAEPAATDKPAPQPAATAAPAPRAPAPTAAATASPAVNTSAAARPAAAAGKRNDRLDLDTTVVTGNRELPKVLYIVPWKKADIGELPAQPFNTLLDEVLTPVDRDVFRREVTYYGAIAGGTDATTGGAASPASGSSPRSEK